jgi:translation initiation factor IF-3
MGVMTPQEALAIARSRGLDLVEIAANAQPPVCKIVDYGKWKYEQAKHERDRHKNKAGKVKELKLRTNIDPHDYKIKVTRAEDFLWHGDKLRVMLQFRGREMAHPELGMELMRRVVADLKTMGHVDMEPKQSGKTINMTLSPLPEHQRVRKFRHPDDKYEMDEHDDESPDSSEETGAQQASA